MIKINSHLLHGVFICSCMLIIFWLGRLSLQYEIHQKLPPIMPLSEINPKIPVVYLEKIDQGFLLGTVNKPNIRIQTNTALAEMENNTFRLPLDSLGIKSIERRDDISLPSPEIEYVASKNGKYFYKITDKEIKKLNLKNLRFFITKEEALKAGYIEKSR